MDQAPPHRSLTADLRVTGTDVTRQRELWEAGQMLNATSQTPHPSKPGFPVLPTIPELRHVLNKFLF